MVEKRLAYFLAKALLGANRKWTPTIAWSKRIFQAGVNNL
jgi:hypothetical protein